MARYDIYDKDNNHIGYAEDAPSGSLLNMDLGPFIIGVIILELIIVIPIALLGGIGAALSFIFWYSVIIGVSMGIGALIGWTLGTIENKIKK